MADADPLIVTLRLDAASFSRFDAARRAHFPPERNVLPAHLTLFHKLPGGELERIAADLEEVAGRTARLPLPVGGVRFLGQGSAYLVTSPPLDALRAELARRWQGWLSPQDAQRFRAHVTIQNKAPPPQAKTLFAELTQTFAPFEAEGTGLLLWHYRGGPWEAAGAFDFDADGPTTEGAP